jgi:hypothetical protein
MINRTTLKTEVSRKDFAAKITCGSGKKTCPDSSLVSRSGLNCEFEACPGEDTGKNCSDLGKGFAAPTDIFNLSDISELEKIFLGITEGSGVDANEDGRFSYADVVSIVGCYLRKWNWSGSTTKAQVKTIEGRVGLFINGKELKDPTFADIYYYRTGSE